MSWLVENWPRKIENRARGRASAGCRETGQERLADLFAEAMKGAVYREDPLYIEGELYQREVLNHR